MKDVIQFHSNRDQININSIPRMFTEQQSNVVKEVMHKIKFPTGFCANMKNIITKKGDFVGVKTHDWHLQKGNYYCIIVFLIPMHIVVILFVHSLFKK